VRVKRNTHISLVGKSERKRLLENPMIIWEDNIEIKFQQISMR
jgi:hypothetical protein